MNITVVGSGYVGLVAGVCLAELGNNVTCIDANDSIIKKLRNGKVPFHEPGLDEMLLNAINSDCIKFTTSYKVGLKNSDAIFVCVGTPPKKNGDLDLKYLIDVFISLAKNIGEHGVIFIKSTVSVGTNQKMQSIFKKYNKNPKIHFASNPEFLKEGDAINDFKKPDRIIIGTDNEEVKEISNRIYKPFNRQTNRMIFTNIESAELIKYAANSFLATKISFINEIARLCEKSYANIDDVRRGLGSDPRIGSQFLYPGLGYGGSCFPKDVKGLVKLFDYHKVETNVIKAADQSNNIQLEHFQNKIKEFVKKPLLDCNILLWGLSFKPQTDDVRESRAINLIKLMSKQVKGFYLYDPVAIPNSKRELSAFSNLYFLDNKYSKIKNCDFLIICTEWREFWDPDIKQLKKLKERMIFDGRNILDKQTILDANIEYHGIGR